MTAREKSTTGERRELRLEAMRYLGSTGSFTKSGRAFLRRKIPELRELKAAETRTSTITKANADVHAFVHPGEAPATKRYGGYPQNDNPQTWARSEHVAESQRRKALERLSDTEITNIAFDCYRSPEFQLKADHNLRMQVWGVYREFTGSYTLKDKNTAIDRILQAEALIKPKEGHPIPKSGDANSETLSTDLPFLQSLTDPLLLDHAKKLLKNNQFLANSNREKIGRLTQLISWVMQPLYAHERRELIDTIVASQETRPKVWM